MEVTNPCGKQKSVTNPDALGHLLVAQQTLDRLAFRPRAMPVSRYDELDTDLAPILAEAGILVTWNGTDYLTIVADSQVQLDLQFVAPPLAESVEVSAKVESKPIMDQHGKFVDGAAFDPTSDFSLKGRGDLPAELGHDQPRAKRGTSDALGNLDIWS